MDVFKRPGLKSIAPQPERPIYTRSGVHDLVVVDLLGGQQPPALKFRRLPTRLELVPGVLADDLEQAGSSDGRKAGAGSMRRWR